MNAQTVLLVEDDPRYRQGMRSLLNLYSSEKTTIEVIGEAESVEQALSLLVQHRPTLVLLDLELGNSNGIAFLLRLRSLPFSSKTLVLSAHEEDEWIFRAIQAGATGYVFKHQAGTQLFEAIEAILQSEIYLPRSVANCFFRLFQAREMSRLQACQRLQLTEREYEILSRLAQGNSNEEIAEQLYVTVATIKAHLTNIFDKLQVTNRAQAIVAAFKLGLVQP
ncbi:response regulator transcription factor [Cyanobacteria bacterium FACHB-63]|nr:response regulator transcription factor [Cyanobacteria bacterium FACHB-63]